MRVAGERVQQPMHESGRERAVQTLLNSIADLFVFTRAKRAESALAKCAALRLSTWRRTA